ncbi:MAG: DoxX family membrane protein [Chloroflexi bacterium]|nr:DoxX family membrane protein [Chloroflexota bacterium]
MGAMRGKAIALGLALVLTAGISSARSAFAHERWFVEEGTHPGQGFPTDLISLSVLLGAFAFLVLAVASARGNWSRRANVLAKRAQRFLPNGAEWRVVAVLTGIMLIANSVTGVFLAPNLVLGSGWPAVFATVVQVLIGLMLLSQVAFALAGLLVLVVAVPLALFLFPVSSLADYILEYASLGLAFVFVGLSSCPDQFARRWTKVDPERFSHLPLPILRAGLGLSLIVLAVHNKLANPDLALTFLDNHNLNFMAALGFASFTNAHFVFAAGVAELVLGVLLLTGLTTRLVAAMLAGFFLTTLIVLGVPELVGHLPLLGIVAVLGLRGSGDPSLDSTQKARPRRWRHQVDVGVTPGQAV